MNGNQLSIKKYRTYEIMKKKIMQMKNLNKNLHHLKFLGPISFAQNIPGWRAK